MPTRRLHLVAPSPKQLVRREPWTVAMPDLHHYGSGPEFGAQCGQAHGLDAYGTWHELHHSADVLWSISRNNLPVCSSCLAAARESRANLQGPDVACSIANFLDRRPNIDDVLKDEISSLLSAGRAEYFRQQEKRVELTHACSFSQSNGAWRWQCSCGTRGCSSPSRASCKSAHDRHKSDELSRILSQESDSSDVQIRDPNSDASAEN